MPVRLKGENLAALRQQCLERDGGRCTDCGITVFDDLPDWSDRKFHMAHIISRGAAGGDTLGNVTTKCQNCHLVQEHCGGKVVPAK